MRVFVLGTGRCGTTSFIRASEHLECWTAGHETRSTRIGDDRFDYPDNHIEADNRLTWFLGELGRRFSDASYVHLVRDSEAVARSFLNRWPTPAITPKARVHRFLHPVPAPSAGIIEGFAHSIVPSGEVNVADRMDYCRFYVRTVTANIEAFLVGKRHIQMRAETMAENFGEFADWIGAEGDWTAIQRALAQRHNARAL